MRSVSSAVKKAPAKEPIEILQDLLSTSKQTHVCDTPQKKRLKCKAQALRTKLWRKRQFTKPKTKTIDSLVAELKHHLPIETVGFIERQIMLQHSKKCNHRYAIKDKMMALSIYYQSPKAYKLLSKLFALPSKRTIQHSLENTNVKPGFNDAVFHALQIKCNTMDDKDKCVALIFDEMSLKSSLVYNHGLDKIEGFEDFGELGTSQFVADHALVFMVRGSLSKWKQPLAYFLTAGTVKPETL